MVNAITTSERNHTPQGFKRKFHNNAPRNINNTQNQNLNRDNNGNGNKWNSRSDGRRVVGNGFFTFGGNQCASYCPHHTRDGKFSIKKKIQATPK